MGDHINEEEQEEIESESRGTELDPVAFAEFTSKDDWEDYQVDNVSTMAISEAFKIKNTTSWSEDDLNRRINKLKTKTEDLLAIADSGIPMSFLNKKTARRLQDNDESTVFTQIPPGDTARNLACYNGERIIPTGGIIVTIESGGRKIRAAPFIIVDDQIANIIDRKFYHKLE